MKLDLTLNDEESLVNTIAVICQLAQDHVRDSWNSYGELVGSIDAMMEPTSYMVACLLAQNTVDGEGGVDWDVVHNKLVYEPLKKEQWQFIAKKIIKKFGGFSKKS